MRCSFVHSVRISPLAFALTACSGGTFELAVRVPDRYDEHVTEIRLSVLEPPIAAPFGCEDLAYGFVDASVLSVSTERELILTRLEETALGELDRAGRRVFSAVGSANGEAIAMGCAEVELLEAREVALVLEPIVDVEALTVSLSPGEPRIELHVTDVLGDPQADVPATWAFAERGASSDGAVRSGAGGELVVTTPEPRAVGPFVVDVRVRWGTDNPMRASGFVRPTAGVVSIPGAFADAAFGRFGAGHEIAVLTADPSPSLSMCGAEPFACGPAEALPEPARLFVDGGEPDRLLLIGAAGWYELDGSPIRLASGPGAVPDVAAAAGDCGEGEDVLLHFGGPDHRVYTPDGAPRADQPLFDLDAALLGSGCVTTSDGRLARTYVLRNDLDESFLVAHQDGDAHFASWSAVGDGVAIGVRGDGPLLGTQLDLNEFVIARFQLDIYDDGLDLDPIEVDYPPAFPIAVTGGSFDGDIALDVAAILTDYDPELDRNRFLLWVALDDAPSGERISGAANLDDLDLCDDGAPILIVADFAEDGRDDIVLVDRGDRCGRDVRLIALPM
jgi:hypothetical protein